jgi:hypothetical protein
MQSSPGGLPWKLVLQVFVVGLFALGLLVWTIVERRQAPAATGDRVLQPVANNPQPSPPPVAASLTPVERVAPPDRIAPPERIAPPVVASPSTTESAAPAMATPSITGVAEPVRPQPSIAPSKAVPSAATTAAEPTPPAPRTGKVRFAIQPWGEVLVDGKSRGVSPPLKELSIPEGRHRIQIRNGGFPGYDSELDVKAGSKDEIAYSFKAP